ncbi:hypothetical protein D187_007974 [Cystobacter fuscus DSM 2262]|uniref:Uncharacterized protein n=1 Tax=Cystobacter fuscus (strain ATCC 25194 / DSM 2262 / NBRC 100088 / M29) TaxID=1242864 RepID=S9P330_CYSF2|nr:hypothetical protein D187_007974 [Cystobacter fuscus DSM 2262]
MLHEKNKSRFEKRTGTRKPTIKRQTIEHLPEPAVSRFLAH